MVIKQKTSKTRIKRDRPSVAVPVTVVDITYAADCLEESSAESIAFNDVGDALCTSKIEDPENELFNSMWDRQKDHKETKKTKDGKKKTAQARVPESISCESEMPIKQPTEPPPMNDSDAAEMARIKEQQEIETSLFYENENGQRLKRVGNKFIIHPNQNFFTSVPKVQPPVKKADEADPNTFKAHMRRIHEYMKKSEKNKKTATSYYFFGKDKKFATIVEKDNEKEESTSGNLRVFASPIASRTSIAQEIFSCQKDVRLRLTRKELRQHIQAFHNWSGTSSTDFNTPINRTARLSTMSSSSAFVFDPDENFCSTPLDAASKPKTALRPSKKIQTLRFDEDSVDNEVNSPSMSEDAANTLVESVSEPKKNDDRSRKISDGIRTSSTAERTAEENLVSKKSVLPPRRSTRSYNKNPEPETANSRRTEDDTLIESVPDQISTFTDDRCTSRRKSDPKTSSRTSEAQFTAPAEIVGSKKSMLPQRRSTRSKNPKSEIVTTTTVLRETEPSVIQGKKSSLHARRFTRNAFKTPEPEDAWSTDDVRTDVQNTEVYPESLPDKSRTSTDKTIVTSEQCGSAQHTTMEVDQQEAVDDDQATTAVEVDENHDSSFVAPAHDKASLTRSLQLTDSDLELRTFDTKRRRTLEDAASRLNEDTKEVPAPSPDVTIATLGFTNDTKIIEQSTMGNWQDSLTSQLADLSIDRLLKNASETGLTKVNQSVGGNVSQQRAPSAMSVVVDPSYMSLVNGTSLNCMLNVPFYLEEMVPSASDTELTRLLHVVNQNELLQWSELPKDVLKKPVKLGEGTYGEVFGTSYNGQPVALKVVPFEPDGNNRIFDGMVNGEQIFASEVVLPEIVAQKELTKLADFSKSYATTNFVQLLGVNAVRGKYPPSLLKSWDAYAKKKESLNDRPSSYATDDQCFLVFALSNGGRDLEFYKLKNEDQIFSILIQTCLALLVAEEVLEFEHRDLHLGNVLIKESDEPVEYKYADTKLSVNSHGVKTTIIDFTLSRIKKQGTTVYRNLADDEELFEGKGDYQFDVYRMVRENNGNDWLKFSPKSNCLWVHFLATKMLTDPNIKPKMTAKRRKELQQIFDKFLLFGRISDSIEDEEFNKVFYEKYVTF